MSKTESAGAKLIKSTVHNIFEHYAQKTAQQINEKAINEVNRLTDQLLAEKMRLTGELAPYIWSQQMTIEKAATIAGLELESFRAVLKHHNPKDRGIS